MSSLWLLLAWFLVAASAQRQSTTPDCACLNRDAVTAHEQGIAAHRLRRLDEASAAYDRALSLEPSRNPSSSESALILRHAPRVFIHAREPFELRDAAAILHPQRPWIAYHLFWEDDIDFPDDNDPCDHELLWVELDAARLHVVNYYTYFHGRILQATSADVEQANREGGRPRVVVQWGKHGTMPWRWRSLPIQQDAGDIEFDPKVKITTLEDYNHQTWSKLSTVGRQKQDSPLARGWPRKFTGDWSDFTRFDREVDPRPLLRAHRYWRVSVFNNAVINREFLRYNFSAKTEWPAAMCR